MIAAEPVLIIRHSLRRRIANPQLPGKSPEHRAQHDIHFGVRERHANALPGTTSEGHHVVIEVQCLLGALQPALGVELHRVGEDFRVAMHHPRRHADDSAGCEELAMECGAKFGDYTW